jgi:hypothetical protein
LALLGAVFLAFLALILFGAWSFRSQNRRIAALLSRLEAIENRRLGTYEARFAAPVDDTPPGAALPPMDTAGAWAWERKNAGIETSDEELALQRRMRIEAGL